MSHLVKGFLTRSDGKDLPIFFDPSAVKDGGFFVFSENTGAVLLAHSRGNVRLDIDQILTLSEATTYDPEDA